MLLEFIFFHFRSSSTVFTLISFRVLLKLGFVTPRRKLVDNQRNDDYL